MKDGTARLILRRLIAIQPLLFSLSLFGCSSIEPKAENVCQFGHSRTLDGRDADDDVYEAEWEMKNGLIMAIGGKQIGEIDWDAVSMKNEDASREIKRFIFDTGLLIGEPSNYEFLVTDHKLHYGGYAAPRVTIKFHQVLNGLSVPVSTIKFDSDSQVDYVRLLVASPCSPIFDQENWLSEDELVEGLKRHATQGQGKYEPDQHTGVVGYMIGYPDGQEALIPLLELDYRSSKVFINALSGKVERIQGMAVQ